MPFLYDQEDEDQQQPEQSVSGENTTVTSDTTVKDPKSSTGSGSFTNLKSYLDANEGNQFGKQVAGKVEGVADEAQAADQQASSQFKQRADQSAVTFDSNLVDSAANDSANFVQDQSNVDAFKKMRDAQYSGPKSTAEAWDIYEPAQQKADKAGQVGKAAQNESGRFALLDEFYKRADYGRGQKSLDNLLIQNDPNARTRIQDASQKNLGAMDQYQQNVAANNQYAQQRMQDTVATKAQIQDRFLGEQGVVPTLESELQNRYNTAIGDAESKYGQYGQQLSGLKANDELLALLGMQAGDATYNLDLGNYLQLNKGSLGSSVSKEEQARLAALSSLLDRENTIAPSADEAGTFDPSKAISTASSLGSDITSRKNAMNAEINSTKAGGDHFYSTLPLPEAIGQLQLRYNESVGQNPQQADYYLHWLNDAKAKHAALIAKHGGNKTLSKV
jgi:hypothetical protein